MPYKVKRKYNLYKELDSIYANFEKAVALNYEVEAISRLEYSAAKNQALQIQNKFMQAYSDYAIALQQLNLWLVSDEFYTVSDEIDIESEINVESFSLEAHPLYTMSQLQVDEAEANYRAAKAENLPKFNLQGGLQKVNGNSGFYTYQAGISIPFLSGTNKAQIRTAKIDKEIAETNMQFKKRKYNLNLIKLKKITKNGKRLGNFIKMKYYH